MARGTERRGWLLVCLGLLLAAPGGAGELSFAVSRVEDVRAFQPLDGFQLAPLAHTAAVNIRLNQLEGRIKRHVHPQSDHFLYVIKGQVELTVGADAHVVGAGDFVTIPHGVSHAMRRLGDSAALFLDVAAPPDVGDVIWQE